MRKHCSLHRSPCFSTRHGHGKERECPTALARVEGALRQIRECASYTGQVARRQGRRVRALALVCACFAACAGERTLAQTHGQLAGARLIENGAACAGWKFSIDGTAARYDEGLCKRGDRPSLMATVRWLSADQLILIESNESGPTPDRPPRVWLFKMESLSAKTVQLREIWLGWGAGGDALATFHRTR
jgi:hypothetical protein